MRRAVAPFAMEINLNLLIGYDKNDHGGDIRQHE
jgi:hypothetical protein